MTNGEFLVREIIDKKGKINALQEELFEFEADLSGMEFVYKDNYAVIESVDAIDGQVTLYIEDDDRCSWNEMISLYELLEIFKG